MKCFSSSNVTVVVTLIAITIITNSLQVVQVKNTGNTGADTDNTGTDTDNTGTDTDNTGTDTDNTGTDTDNTGTDTGNTEQSHAGQRPQKMPGSAKKSFMTKKVHRSYKYPCDILTEARAINFLFNIV